MHSLFLTVDVTTISSPATLISQQWWTTSWTMNRSEPCLPGLLSSGCSVQQQERKPGQTPKDRVFLWTTEDSTRDPPQSRLLASLPLRRRTKFVSVCLRVWEWLLPSTEWGTPLLLSPISRRWGFTNWAILWLSSHFLSRLVTSHSKKTAGVTRLNISSEHLVQKQEPSWFLGWGWWVRTGWLSHEV